MHLVIHVMSIEGVSTGVLDHELENHGGNQWEPHLDDEMIWSECELVRSKSM